MLGGFEQIAASLRGRRVIVGWSKEHIALPVRLLDTTAGDVEVGWLALNADKGAAGLYAGNAGGSGAHEGVEDEAGVLDEGDAPLHDRIYNAALDQVEEIERMVRIGTDPKDIVIYTYTDEDAVKEGWPCAAPLNRSTYMAAALTPFDVRIEPYGREAQHVEGETGS